MFPKNVTLLSSDFRSVILFLRRMASSGEYFDEANGRELLLLDVNFGVEVFSRARVAISWAAVASVSLAAMCTVSAFAYRLVHTANWTDRRWRTSSCLSSGIRTCHQRWAFIATIHLRLSDYFKKSMETIFIILIGMLES